MGGENGEEKDRRLLSTLQSISDLVVSWLFPLPLRCVFVAFFFIAVCIHPSDVNVVIRPNTYVKDLKWNA